MEIAHATGRAARIVAFAGTVLIAPSNRSHDAVPTISPALDANGAQGCKFSVVPCNYAFMYSGTISWEESINGPAGSFNATAKVTVNNGVGVCTGSATSVSISQFGRTSATGSISGKALVAVEFDYYEEVANVPANSNSSSRPLGYKVTAACPSPDWPARPDGTAATPATPAQLDGRERSSYPQFATAISQKELKGTNSSSPEEDTVNGVTSLLVVKWDLKRP